MPILDHGAQTPDSTPTETQRCCHCHVTKPLDAFNRDKGQRLGRTRICRVCKKATRGDRTEEHRRDNLRRRKMTDDIYAEWFEKQRGGCAICGGLPPSGRRLVIDHDHSCCTRPNRSCERCTRGLLCYRCNLLVELLTDRSWVDRATAYLTAHRRSG